VTEPPAVVVEGFTDASVVVPDAANADEAQVSIANSAKRTQAAPEAFHERSRQPFE
jgi:hypothetical protein